MSNLLTFSVTGENENATKLVANARNFRLVIDEPLELGGTDHDANPVEYLLAGYAGCVNVVAHLVAKELGLPIKKLKLEVSGDLNPAKFLGSSNKERAGFQQIHVKLTVDTTASTALLQEWLNQIERRCPINDNLSNPTPTSLSVEKSAA